MKPGTKFCLSMGLAAALSLAAVAAQDAFTLKRNVKVGDVMKSKMTVEADFGGTAILITATTTEKVVKMEDSGIVHTESSQSNMKIKFGDQEMGGEDQPPTTYITKITGELVELKGESIEASYYRMASMTSFRFPEGPVKAGDKWTYEIKADKKTGIVSGKHEYEVVGPDKVGARECLKVKHSYKETEGGEPASSTGTVWIDLKDGSMVKLEASQQKVPVPQAPGPMDMKLKIEREG